MNLRAVDISTRIGDNCISVEQYISSISPSKASAPSFSLKSHHFQYVKIASKARYEDSDAFLEAELKL
jgi:hypothetical protein